MDLRKQPPAGTVPPAGFPVEERQWATMAHLSAFAGLLIPFGNILGPLVIWLIKREQFPFVDDQGKEALNFQITVMIAATASVLLMYLLIGFFLIVVVGVFAVIVTIIAAIKANRGQHYRYPLCLRFVQ